MSRKRNTGWLVLAGVLLAFAASPAGQAPAPKAVPAASPAPSPAAKGAKASGKPVNRNEILSLYMSGEFETLVALLENIRRDRRVRDREDSIFIYKFLGVIYGANDNTKKKAEAFLYQMLKLDPEEDLSSLGVGDSVEAIFERVRNRVGVPARDSVAVASAATEPAATPAPAPAAPAAAQSQPAASGAYRNPPPKWVWYAAGGAAAAALVTGVVLLNQEPDRKIHAISDTLR